MMKKHSIQHLEVGSTPAKQSRVLLRNTGKPYSRVRDSASFAVSSCRKMLWYFSGLVFGLVSGVVLSFSCLLLSMMTPNIALATPSQSELASLRRDAMALFADRKSSQAIPEKRPQRSLASDRALAAGWRQALGNKGLAKENVFEQQRVYAQSDRRMIKRQHKRPMVILPRDVDIDVALLTMHDNPSFEGATVVLLEMPFLRELTALQRAYGHLDIRIVENSAIRKELDWVDLPILVTETGRITKFHF